MNRFISHAYAQACFNPKIVENSDGCWIWTGYFSNKIPNGHLRTKIISKGHHVNVRRWIWERAFCKLLPKFHVKTTCGDVYCVNPDHVQVVLSGKIDRTFQPKIVRKNGRNCWATVITPSMAKTINVLQQTGESQTKIARAVGCHQSTISRFLKVAK